MLAIVRDVYGPPEVLRIEEQPAPEVPADHVLVDVRATSVTTAEWRMRAADFPPGFRLLGRLFTGLFRPRVRTTGREFAGTVRAVGSAVTDLRPGDEVFGVHEGGANAEQIAVPASGVIVRMPAGLSHAEAVAMPFGSLTAIDFLEDRAQVQPGERVLVVGASGGVGVYAVQVAKQAGAEVVGVCSTANLELVRSLGADAVVDYTKADPRDAGETYDVVVDTAGKTSVSGYRDALRPGGRHVFIEGGFGSLLHALVSRWRRGPRVIGGVTLDTRAAFERLRARVEAGRLRPVVGHRFAMADVVDAHRLVERRHRRGAVVLDFPV
ncbi:MAG: NAD(P)-dependent alcohol dehydrogenase [Myxococcota bacterium]